MSHHVYTTEGVVIESMPSGDTGKVLRIFTRELGMVFAKATGIRQSQSKLRYHTQDHTHASFSLVRGREVWRLVGASSSERRIAHDKTHGVYVRILSILKRLLPGEEAHPELFTVIESLRLTLERSGWVTGDINNPADLANLVNIECLTMLRIMARLGYLKDDQDLKGIAMSDKWDEETMGAIAKYRSRAVTLINHALKESQL